MTNEELKKKIVEILVNCKSDECAIDLCSECTGNPCISNCREKEQADALILAGIGDVKEAEQRAEVAERALKRFAENVTCEDCPFFSDCSSLERMKDSVHSNYCFAEYLRQAEKELAEERKDD